jgi:hypothetical protein
MISNMDIVDIVVKVLEGLSYICAIGVLIIAIKGLSQITIARQSLSLGSKRDALRVTDSQVVSFFSVTMPQYDASKITREEKDILETLIIDEQGHINFKAIKKENKQKLPDFNLNKKSDRDRYEHFLRVIFNKKRESFNMVEAFSSSFVSGLADEKSAYATLGKAYCIMIENYENLLSYFGSKGYYKNTLILYRLWNKRLVKEEAEKEVRLLEKNISESDKSLNDAKKKLSKVKREIGKIEDEQIVSIGTEG